MKNEATIKNSIGLTQEEAAMFLVITRSQWSMFVSGKRVLPLTATQKFAKLLEHLQAEKPFSITRQQIAKAEIETLQQKLQHDLLTIQIKHYKVAQKINKMEIIRKECFAALEVAHFIENQKEKHPIGSLAEYIKKRVIKTLKRNDLYALTELKLKKESLEVQKNTLEKRIKGL